MPRNLPASNLPTLSHTLHTDDSSAESRTHFIKQLWRDRLKGVQRNVEVCDWEGGGRRCRGEDEGYQDNLPHTLVDLCPTPLLLFPPLRCGRACSL